MSIHGKWILFLVFPLLFVSGAGPAHGENWILFNKSHDGTLWYYRAMVGAYAGHGASPLVEELDRVVSELERLAAAGAR